jgi:phospholipid/cholesterol/gamma-HCH transport system substrate-binding protein
VPTRKEIQWSQLRVGALVLGALAVFIALIFLMSGATGGLFAKKLTLRAYFPNASGLKNGAPVTLSGVTIGNILRMNIVPDHNPNPVEVIMQVGRASAGGIHTDTTATITQAGVLGDSYVDLDSTHATGPIPPNNSVLKVSDAPTVQDVIRSSSETIDQIKGLSIQINTLAATLNSRKGLAGELINDPALAKKVVAIADNLQTITNVINSGQGTLGKLVKDDAIYNRASSAVDKLNDVATSLQQGKGTAGKLLKDDTLYNNLNSAVANTNQLVANVNAGQGALGKLAKDPEFARKLDETITNLDAISKKINAGQGTLGQLVENRALFDHIDQTADQAQQLLQAFRENPKKYLQVKVRLF